jgi:hypothetical protein
MSSHRTLDRLLRVISEEAEAVCVAEHRLIYHEFAVRFLQQHQDFLIDVIDDVVREHFLAERRQSIERKLENRRKLRAAKAASLSPGLMPGATDSLNQTEGEIQHGRS